MGCWMIKSGRVELINQPCYELGDLIDGCRQAVTQAGRPKHKNVSGWSYNVEHVERVPIGGLGALLARVGLCLRANRFSLHG